MGLELPRAEVLIVDDDTAFAAGLQALLQEETPYHIDVAHDCHTALTTVLERKGLYDVVIMDQQFYGQDKGLTCMNDIKEIDPHIQTIFLTGHGEIDYAFFALEHGAFRYLHKPPEPNELIAVIALAYKYTSLSRKNHQLVRDQNTLRDAIIKCIALAVIGIAAIVALDTFIEDNFLPAIIGFVAILAVLFPGWQGIHRVRLSGKKDDLSVEIETNNRDNTKKKCNYSANEQN